ncbi:VOC family protein [Oryzifoliimicrobium ureilyticus]|uniref:VOC family protein n=1 Tax=Oryzifoliimicrobium ureilyticus TaxID=3113724 RepID=UPI0030765DEB
MTNSVLLYVSDAPASTRFYSKLLGLEPVEAGQTFAMFILPSGLGLGLWGRAGVEPQAAGAPGSSEIGFKVEQPDEVDALHGEWVEKGAEILLAPTELDFGRTFVALDPDGHRLRVYTVNEG